MCPLQSAKKILIEAATWPKYDKAYLRAFARAIKNKPELTAKSKHKTPEQMRFWWINGYDMELDKRQKILSHFGVDIFDTDQGCGSVGDARFE
jgi:hypothetical protein